MLRKNRGEVNVIVILLVIVLILGLIFTLKVTGVIKSNEKQIDNNITTNIQLETDEVDEVVEIDEIGESIYRSSKTIIGQMEKIAMMIIIVILIITIGINIGICKLYSKLSIPSYIVKLNFIWPIITIINTVLPATMKLIVSLIAGILSVMTTWYYFKALGMSGWWAILPFAAVILLFLPFVGLAAFVVFIIAYVLSNIRLAKKFNKGTGFTIGLAILPFIFQPILGYQRNTETLKKAI